MKFSVLERLLFVLVFFLTATICVGFLFGYRYSFDQQRVEQRGVLVLSGKQDSVHLILDGKMRRASLPYVDTNVPIGTHSLLVEKPGYTSFQTTFEANTAEATIIPVELPPHLLTGQKQTFPVEENDSVGYFEGLGVVKHTSASGTILLYNETKTPKEVYLPTQLRMAERKKLAITQISDSALLLSTNQLYFLYSASQDTWQQIFVDPTEVLSVDQGVLISFSPVEGVVREMSTTTGRPGEILLRDVEEITQSGFRDTDEASERALYRQKNGATYRLQPRWFAGAQMEQFSTYDELQTTFAPLTLTQSGALMVENSLLLPSVERVVYNNESLYIVQKSGAVFTATPQKGLTFLNRFSSRIIGVYTEPGKLYSYIQTETALYFCEQKSLSYCSQLAKGFASIKRGVDTDNDYIWYFDKENILTIVPFFTD